MDENIWKGKWKGINGIKEQWRAMTHDEIADIEGKQEKLADLLQEHCDSKDEAEEHYTLFE